MYVCTIKFNKFRVFHQRFQGTERPSNYCTAENASVLVGLGSWEWSKHSANRKDGIDMGILGLLSGCYVQDLSGCLSGCRKLPPLWYIWYFSFRHGYKTRAEVRSRSIHN